MKVKIPTHDFSDFSGKEREMFNLHMTIMKNQLRIKLLKSLLNQKLATRDIFFFLKGQTEQRTVNNKIDAGRTISYGPCVLKNMIK